MGMKSRKPPKSAAREGVLLDELQDVYGYTLLDVRRKRDRYETQMNMTEGTCTEVRMLRLAVPKGSALYAAFAKRDEAEDRKKIKKKGGS